MRSYITWLFRNQCLRFSVTCSTTGLKTAQLYETAVVKGSWEVAGYRARASWRGTGGVHLLRSPKTEDALWLTVLVILKSQGRRGRKLPQTSSPLLSECSLCVQDCTFVDSKNFLSSLNNLPWERTANDVRPFIVHANICAAYTLDYLKGFEDSHGCANVGAIAKLRVLVSVSSRSEFLMVTICHVRHLYR